MQSKFYNAFFVTEYGKIESLRAKRYNRVFSLILMEIDNFHDLKRGLDKGELLTLLRKIIKAIMGVVRDHDVVGMIEDKRIVAILPETDFFNSMQTIRKVKKVLDEIVMGWGAKPSLPPVSFTFAHASYPRDGNGYDEIFYRAEERVKDKRGGLWVRLGLEGMPFWEVVSVLLKGGYDCSPDSTIIQSVSLPFIERIQRMTIQEVVRDSKKNGVLYLSLRGDTSFLKGLGIPDPIMTRIFIVGGEGIPNTTPLYLSDKHLLNNHLILLLREDISYALLYRVEDDGGITCFHTVDPYLIDGLIIKFQQTYSL